MRSNIDDRYIHCEGGGGGAAEGQRRSRYRAAICCAILRSNIDDRYIHCEGGGHGAVEDQRRSRYRAAICCAKLRSNIDDRYIHCDGGGAERPKANGEAVIAQRFAAQFCAVIYMLGQFYTKNKMLQEKVYEFVYNNPSEILEPCVGRGDLVLFINKQNPKIKFDVFEIDQTISDFVIDKKTIKFCDFLQEPIKKLYTTIIGNPPYVRTSKGNLYLDFIKRCYDLLELNGELVFIVPSDFFKLTCAAQLLNDMLTNGTFTHIFHPHDENLFEGAMVDVIVFRYCKNSKLQKKLTYNTKTMHLNNNLGFVTFTETQYQMVKAIGDYFDIYVGFVTGCDQVFQNNELSNVSVLWSQNRIKKFILINTFPCRNKAINDHLLKNKDQLLARKIRKFNDKNWFQWGALRNRAFVEANEGKPCIYLRNMSRSNQIAFKGKVGYFGPGLFLLFPKTNKTDLDKFLVYLNSEEFQKHFIYAKRFKIGNNQLAKAPCPF